MTRPADQTEPVVRQGQVVRAALAAPKCNFVSKRLLAPELLRCQFLFSSACPASIASIAIHRKLLFSGIGPVARWVRWVRN